MALALITGATGFVGRHLVASLRQEGVKTRLLIRNRTRIPLSWFNDRGIEILESNLADLTGVKRACEGADVIFHLAGKSDAEVDRKNTGDHREHTGFSRILSEAASVKGVQSFIYFSSVKVMGEASGQCLNENISPQSQTPYAVSRWESEKLILANTRLPHVSVLRLTPVYGPGCGGNLMRMLRLIKLGIFPPLPDVGNKRSFVAVHDVVQAAHLVMKNPASNRQTYIVSGDEAPSTRDLYIYLCDALGKKVPSWTVPFGVFQKIARLGEGTNIIFRRRLFPMDEISLSRLFGSAWYSCDKIKRELGYQPKFRLQGCLPEIISHGSGRSYD
ncbi:MAG: NAD-dependent epimerase/dehydratase family protein [Elusimicrobia bacterium]|nr:NAD-dependent epimerase/dehydratase family protein [Elusimicrobiota bacterium]